jgi:hypothetical protein
MPRRFRRLCAILTLTAAPALAESPAPEPVTIDAFSIWEASGSVVAIGPTAHAFAGEMHGPYFIDAGAGPIPAGTIACVGALEADSESGRQTGAARCRLQANDGAVAYGRFACEGWRMVGCAGVFLLEGGEGRLAGARGEGPIVLRRYETALAGSGDGRVTELALGIASWKGFTLTAAPPAP